MLDHVRAERVVGGSQPVAAASDEVFVDLHLIVRQTGSEARVRLFQEVNGTNDGRQQVHLHARTYEQ